MNKRQRSIIKTFVAGVIALAAGFVVTYAATDGFAAFTLESARRLAVFRAPKPVPETLLELADGTRQTLTALDAPVLLVDFIYTRCTTYCTALGSMSARVQRELAPEIAAGGVRLVSISFDPTHDGPAQLQAYRRRFSQDAYGWYLARPAKVADLPALLAAFGVVAIPDEWGGFTHNAAFHVVGPDRKLTAILDLGDIEGVAAAARHAGLEHPAGYAGLH